MIRKNGSVGLGSDMAPAISQFLRMIKAVD
jgi:hypothetical protein